jgi:hypothetical protein
MRIGPADQACPGCGDTTGVQPTPGISPTLKAWSCTACRTNWAITVANPQPYFDQLAATVEQLGAARSVLRHVITLADDASALPDRSCGTGCWRWPPGPGWRSVPSLRTPEASRCLARARPAVGLSGVRPRALPGLPAAGRSQEWLTGPAIRSVQIRLHPCPARQAPRPSGLDAKERLRRRCPRRASGQGSLQQLIASLLLVQDDFD